MKKKTIFITGAGSGLGMDAALALAKRGHKVYATVQYENQADNLNNISKEQNLNLESFKLDIRLEEDRKKIEYYNFDVFISNAAIGDSGSVSEIQVDRIENVFETNVFSNIKITQLAIKNFIKNKKGRVIFVSSLVGRVSMPFLAPYCASKFSLEALAYSLKKEMKQLDGINIDIAIIEPGAYATGFNKENNDKKYDWMKNKSYFKYKLDEIRQNEIKKWNFLEKKSFNSIIKQYINSVEDTRVKFRYTAPKLQAIFIQIERILGI